MTIPEISIEEVGDGDSYDVRVSMIVRGLDGEPAALSRTESIFDIERLPLTIQRTIRSRMKLTAVVALVNDWLAIRHSRSFEHQQEIPGMLRHWQECSNHETNPKPSRPR